MYRQRDRDKMFELLRESLKRQALLVRKFNRMRTVYRGAHSQLSSPNTWKSAVFDQLVEPANR